MLATFLAAKSNNIFKCRHKGKGIGNHQDTSHNNSVKEREER